MRRKTFEFSKKLLVVDYIMMAVLIACTAIFQNVDFITLDVAWIAQLGISSAAYYWKAKNDNRTKIPMAVIESLPRSVREDVDLTQIICAIVQSE